MLRKSKNPGRIAPTCFANFRDLTRTKWLLPVNPAFVRANYPPSTSYEQMQSGFAAFITPARHLYTASGWTARRARRAVWDIEFPLALPADFIRLLKSWQDQNCNVGIYLPSALPQPEAGASMHARDKDELWSDGNGYWYTQVYPFVESSLILYKKDGTIIYQYGGREGTVNTYSVVLDGSNGRVFFPGSVPSLGKVFATYDHLIYGKLMDLPLEPLPNGEFALYTSHISIQEAEFPTVTTAYRLHLNSTPPTGVTMATIVLVNPGSDSNETVSSQVRAGLAGTPVIGGLHSAHDAALYEELNTVVGDGEENHDLWGVYASYPLADQVLPSGTTCDVGACYDAQAAQGLTPEAIVYLWRPYIGLIAVLSNPDPLNSDTRIGSPQDTAGTEWIYGEVNGPGIRDDVLIKYGDRIVVELWGDYDHNGSASLGFAGGNEDAEYVKGAVIAEADVTMWVQFSHALRIFEE